MKHKPCSKNKIDLSKCEGDVFYKYIYPVLASEFLFTSEYEHFADVVFAYFKLSPIQWDSVLNHFTFKEDFLKIKK